MTPTEELSRSRAVERLFFRVPLMFPRSVRLDLATIHAFAAETTSFAMCTPQDVAGFEAYTDALWEASRVGSSAHPVLGPFVELWSRLGFERGWVDAFVRAVESDFGEVRYQTLKDVEHYLYGAAEVLGLMVARVLALPEKVDPYAQSLARAFRYVGFLRDLEADLGLDRCYLPVVEAKRYGLSGLSRREVRASEGAFRLFVQAQIARYETWQRQAEQGFGYVPKRYRVPIEAATKLHAWMARAILENPLVVFERRISPPPRVIVRETARSIL